jgi:hypothetical protein
MTVGGCGGMLRGERYDEGAAGGKPLDGVCFGVTNPSDWGTGRKGGMLRRDQHDGVGAGDFL